MKKILLSVCIAFSLLATAQTKEGKVIYERSIQMPNHFQGMQNETEYVLPAARADQFELLFGHNQSLWQQLPNANDEHEIAPAGAVVMRFVEMGDNLVYHNFETGKRVEQRELRSKNYLVTDSIRKLAWKLTDETKNILGHTVRKAVAQRYGTRMIMAMENSEMKRQEMRDTTNIIAWITTDIPVPAGPEFQGQLPGLILELNINNGHAVYKAVEISQKVNTSNIKEPKGGKKVTEEQFAKEHEKMMEEMRKNMPSGGVIRIEN